MNHLWRGKAFAIPGPLSSYGVGGPSWGSLFTIPSSYKPGMPFDSSLARLLGTPLAYPSKGGSSTLDGAKTITSGIECTYYYCIGCFSH
jgi:hypothetical protein